MQKKYSEMIAMGIDPGLRNTGWGIISIVNNKINYLGHGVIQTNPNKSEAERLYKISFDMKTILKKFNPLIAYVESIFVSKNPSSALKLGMARGVVLESVASHQISAKELSPRLVKKSITGSGNAGKDQVKYIIQKILMKNILSDDASDALAIAIAGSYQVSLLENKIQNKLEFAIEKAKERQK